MRWDDDRERRLEWGRRYRRIGTDLNTFVPFCALELGRIGRWLIARHPAWLLLGLPLILLPALASVSAPHPAPESLVPQFWAIAFYGSFFVWGTLIHGQPDWLDRSRALIPWLIAGSVGFYAAFP